MKGARLYGAKDLRIEEMEMPRPRPGEALVRIEAVGICGSDVHYFVDGRIGDAVVRAPLILGHEFAGVVEEVGEGVAGFVPGVRVAVEPGVACGACEPCRMGKYNLCLNIRFCGTPPVDGAYRERMVYPVDYLYPLPECVSSEEGAMIETLAVAVHATDLGRERGGEHGCGDRCGIGGPVDGAVGPDLGRERGVRRGSASRAAGGGEASGRG